MKKYLLALAIAVAPVAAWAAFNLPFGTNVSDHLTASSAAPPTVSAATLTAGSTDMAGEFVATGTTGATLTFGTAYNSAPFCVVVNNTTAGDSAATVSKTAITMGTTTASDKIHYVCVAQNGG